MPLLKMGCTGTIPMETRSNTGEIKRLAWHKAVAAMNCLICGMQHVLLHVHEVCFAIRDRNVDLNGLYIVTGR